MSVIRFFALLAIAPGLLLTGCHDTRRDAVRGYLQAHPPEGFEAAAPPGDFTIAGAADGSSQTVVPMRYRLTQSTVEMRDLFSLPRGEELSKRLAAVRGWALSSLPDGDATRDAIASGSSAALAKFPTKRVVTPKGTEIEDPVILKIEKTSGGWQIVPQSPAASVPGLADRYTDVPFENSPDVAAKLDEVEIVTGHLEQVRQKYLADRQQAMARSLARFRSLLKTGNTFEGRLSDQTPVRLVISRGTEAGGSVAAVLTIQHSDHSSARYSGGFIQEPSGETIWRAAQVTSLSGSGADPLTDSGLHPILSLTVAGDGFIAQVKAGSRATISFRLQPAEGADLIPDVSTQ